MSENLRLRVRKKAEEMGYHPGTEPSASQGGAVSIGVPLVCVDFYGMDPAFDYIAVDNFHGMQRLTQKVIVCGHERIGFVGTPLATESIMDRYMGYCKAMEVNGPSLREDWLIYDREEDGYTTILNVSLPEELPTAFVCNCDRSARLLIEQLARRRLRVPEDVSVAGFDHSYVSVAEGLTMTTYECDERTLAREGLKALLKRMEGKGGPAGIRIIEGELVEGNTVARLERQP